MQAGDMKTSNAQGRWFHCEVEGKKMTVNIYDYNNNRMNDESFVLYASEMGQSTVNFGVESGQGTLKPLLTEVKLQQVAPLAKQNRLPLPLHRPVVKW